MTPAANIVLNADDTASMATLSRTAPNALVATPFSHADGSQPMAQIFDMDGSRVATTDDFYHEVSWVRFSGGWTTVSLTGESSSCPSESAAVPLVALNASLS